MARKPEEFEVNKVRKWPEDFLDKVICGDCLEVMKEIPDNSVDLVVTDPPYNVGKNYGENHNDNLPQDEYWGWYRRVFTELFRVVNNGYLYVSSSSFQDLKVRNVLQDIGFTWVQNLIWYRPNIIRGGTYCSKPWLPLHEPIGMFLKGKRRPMLNKIDGLKTADVIIVGSPQRNHKEGRVHPTQKPLRLYRTIIGRTSGDIILDPFVGSGSVAVVCANLGRHFVTIDSNPDYCKIAEERLRQEVLPLKG